MESMDCSGNEAGLDREEPVTDPATELPFAFPTRDPLSAPSRYFQASEESGGKKERRARK